MTLSEKVRERIAFQARKHELCKAEDLEKFIDKEINGWTTVELLEAISIEFESELVWK